MAIYGKGQMLGSGINPESFKQDYSGFTRAAEIQAQGIANLGNKIAGGIEKYGEMKKEQKKVDAYNKASAKSIDAAITLGESYGITDARKVLSPFLEAYNNPNLSPIEKAALLDEGKAMTGNLFGRFDKKQAYLIDQAQINASKQSKVQPLTLEPVLEKIGDGYLSYKKGSDGNNYDETGNVITNMNAFIEGQPLEAYSAGKRQSTADSITSAANMTTPVSKGSLQDRANALNNAAPLPDGSPGSLPAVGTLNPLLPPATDEDLAAISAILAQRQVDSPVQGASTNMTAPPVGEPPASIALRPALKSRVYTIPSGEGQLESRGLNQEEIVAAGLPPGDYIGRFKNDKLTFIQPVPSKPDDIASAREKALDAPNLGYLDVAAASAKKLAPLNAALDLLNSKSVETGIFANYRTEARKLFGQDVSNEEQFNSLVGTLAMEALDLTKGSISNMEQKYFTEVLAPNISKTVDGNKKILEFRIGLAKRDIE